jgi:hypothetical protein
MIILSAAAAAVATCGFHVIINIPFQFLSRLIIQAVDGTNLRCLGCMEGNLQRTYTNEDLNMQIDYFNFMFDIHTYESEGNFAALSLSRSLHEY